MWWEAETNIVERATSECTEGRNEISCNLREMKCVVSYKVCGLCGEGRQERRKRIRKKKRVGIFGRKILLHFLCCQLRQKVKFFMTHRTCSLSRIEIKLNCFKFSIFPKPPSKNIFPLFRCVLCWVLRHFIRKMKMKRIDLVAWVWEEEKRVSMEA